MSRNNVFQVLVTKGNQAVLAAGSEVKALKPGQVGVFDYHTNLAIDGTAPVKDFYLAVGVSEDANGATAINHSSGQVIQKENVRDYTFRPHTAGQPQIFEITDYIVNCETDYTLRFEFRSAQILQRQGTIQYSKPFSVRTSCCGCNTDCPSGSPVELTKLLFHAMENDPMFKVEAITAPDGVTGLRTVIEDIDAYAADPLNAEAKPGLRITVNGTAVSDFMDIPMGYYNPRQVVVIPSLVDGFNCTGKITVTQQALSEEGAGIDIKNKEYFAGGWNGRPGPYRQLASTGLGLGGFVAFADVAAKYDQINLVYDQFSTAGWGEYLNNLQTIIAVPQADTVTRDGIVGILDAVLNNVGKGFEPLADDATAAVVDPAVAEPTAKKGRTKDGIA